MDRRQWMYGIGKKSKARKGEGWHRRGWRDEFGHMAVNITFSPKCYGSHTLEVEPDETAARLRRSAIRTQCQDFDLRGRHVVLVHKKRELVGEKTAADYGIESADTLYLKLFDRYGNQLRWNDYGFCKEYGVGDDHNYDMLVDAFDSDPYADEHDTKRLAKRAGVTPGFVSDWFMWRRSREEVGGDEPGDRGLVAQAERRADNAIARESAARRDAMQAQQAALEARIAYRSAEISRLQAEEVAAQQQERRAQMALSVYGETVSIRPDGPNTPWYDATPGRAEEWAPLLDTGNNAATMISAQVARAAGIHVPLNAPMMNVRGVNGLDQYPMVYVHVAIRGVEQRVCAVLGGGQGILVGRDVIEPMLDMGFTIAGFAAARGCGGAGAYSIRQL